ncbi:uncharacterized protein C8R40DRAFT_1068360 [Lentinula edodes]|uniref:uncharacterized protein n=1 Tax=Lentinula edodes TaxID=5353 RepID=UPI001E8E4CBA|nr:uncharacterized protein C8R40DRAFT_1068360 [Lentinula edodes]KAH7876553.1 hypothetical protein C8R40DRAFT_1068360 [Lentinula edodes]
MIKPTVHRTITRRMKREGPFLESDFGRSLWIPQYNPFYDYRLNSTNIDCSVNILNHLNKIWGERLKFIKTQFKVLIHPESSEDVPGYSTHMYGTVATTSPPDSVYSFVNFTCLTMQNKRSKEFSCNTGALIYLSMRTGWAPRTLLPLLGRTTSPLLLTSRGRVFSYWLCAQLFSNSVLRVFSVTHLGYLGPPTAFSYRSMTVPAPL